MKFKLALFISLCGTTLLFAEEPKKPVPQFVEEFNAIKKEVSTKIQAITEKASDEHDAAKTDAERQSIFEKLRIDSEKIIAPSVEKIFNLVKPHASDPAACELLGWVVNYPSKMESSQAALELLMKHHLVHSETIDLAGNMKQSWYGWVDSLLRAQLASPDLTHEQRRFVLMNLAIHLQLLAEYSEIIANATAADLKRFAVELGEQRFGALKDGRSKHEAEAIKLFTELDQKYGKEELRPGLSVARIAQQSIYSIQNLSIGKIAPDIVGEDLEGVKFKLSDYRGKVVMLSFWGSWSEPCMASISHNRELVERYKGKPFVLIGVNSDEEKIKIRELLTVQTISWRSFWCGRNGRRGPIPTVWNVRTWPATYLIDQDGVIRSAAYAKNLDAKIEKLVAEAEKANAKK